LHRFTCAAPTRFLLSITLSIGPRPRSIGANDLGARDGPSKNRYTEFGSSPLWKCADPVCPPVLDVEQRRIGDREIPTAKEVLALQGLVDDGPPIDRLLATHSYYIAFVIPGDMYAGNPGDVPTISRSPCSIVVSRAPPEGGLEPSVPIAKGDASQVRSGLAGGLVASGPDG
jgi:hypothetical protein